MAADEEEEREALTELTRLVALSLEDEERRRELWQSLAESPFREGKLSFDQYLSTTKGTALADRMAARGGITKTALNDLVSRAPDLEMYVPVPEHRATWTGGSDLIVASSLRDHEIPVGFELSGEPVELSAETPPNTPTLVMVPVETDFSRQPAASEATRLSTTSTSSSGVYMTAAYIPDDHEGWPRGDPEFEVHLQVQQTSQDTAFDAHCAGNDAPNPASRYNHDDAVWEGWVLLAPEQKLANLYALVPDSSVVTFVVWEDDTDPCKIRDENLHWSWWIGAFYGTALGPSAIHQGGFMEVVFGTAILGATVSVVDGLLGSADDIVGALTSSGCQIPGVPTSDPTFTIYDFDDSSSEGCAALRGHPSPPPPLTVNINGETHITSSGQYTWNSGAAGGEGTKSYSWEYCAFGQSCVPAGTLSSYSRQVGSVDPSFQLKVTVTAGTEVVSDTHDVCVEIGGPAPC